MKELINLQSVIGITLSSKFGCVVIGCRNGQIIEQNYYNGNIENTLCVKREISSIYMQDGMLHYISHNGLFAHIQGWKRFESR